MATTIWRRRGCVDEEAHGIGAILAQEQRVGRAGFAEAFGAQRATVAAAARATVGRRVVAAVRQAVVEAELRDRAG